MKASFAFNDQMVKGLIQLKTVIWSLYFFSTPSFFSFSLSFFSTPSFFPFLCLSSPPLPPFPFSVFLLHPFLLSFPLTFFSFFSSCFYLLSTFLLFCLFLWYIFHSLAFSPFPPALLLTLNLSYLSFPSTFSFHLLFFSFFSSFFFT